MLDNVRCPKCRRRLLLPEDLANTNVECPNCATQFWLGVGVPAASQSPSSQEEAILPASRPVPSMELEEPEPEQIPMVQLAPDPEIEPPMAQLAPDPETESNAGSMPTKINRRVGLVVVVSILTMTLTMCCLIKSVERPFFPNVNFPIDDEDFTPIAELPPLNGPAIEVNKEEDERAKAAWLELFGQLGHALETHDQRRYFENFAFNRIHQEITRRGHLPTRELGRFDGQTIQAGLQKRFLDFADFKHWEKSEILDSKWISPREAVVFARHVDSRTGDVVRIRWWLVQQGSGRWLVYDWLDPFGQDRYSLEVFQTAHEMIRLGGVAPAKNMFDSMHLVERAVSANQHQEAQRILDTLNPNDMIPVLRAQHRLYSAILLISQNQPQKALETLEVLERDRPNLDIALLWKSAALNRLQRYREAIPILVDYRKRLGDDCFVGQELGIAYLGAGQFMNAAAEFRKALDFHPKDIENFVSLLESQSFEDARDDLARRYLKLDHPQDFYERLVEICRDRRDGRSLEALTHARKQLKPVHPQIEMNIVSAKLMQRKFDEALSLYPAAFKNLPNEVDRRELTKRLVDGAFTLREKRKVYDTVQDKQAAFAFLSERCVMQFRSAELRALLSAHRKINPNDVLITLCEAHLLADCAPEQAEKLFQKALELKPTEQQLQLFRVSRLVSRFHTAGALSAYRDIGPKKDVYSQLAGLCLNHERFDELDQLIRAHEKEEPKDMLLVSDRMTWFIRSGRYDEASEQLAKDQADAKQKKDLAKDTKPDAKNLQLDLGNFGDDTSLQVFAREMVQADQTLRAYHAIADSRSAFQQLQTWLPWRDDIRVLAPLVDAHRKRDPNDPLLGFVEGRVEAAKKNWPEAARLMKAAWRQMPKELQQIFAHEWRQALVGAGEIEFAYKNSGVPGADENQMTTFTVLADQCRVSRNADALATLIDLHRKSAKAPDDFAFAEWQMHILRKQPALAIDKFQKSTRLKGNPDFEMDGVFRDLAHDGFALEAYRAFGDEKNCFRTLAFVLMDRRQYAELNQLLNEHAKRKPDDKFANLFRGVVLSKDGKHAEAEEFLSDGWAAANDLDRPEFEYELFRVYVKLGKAAAALEDERFENTTFAQLANLCAFERDAKQLRQLLDAYRAKVEMDRLIDDFAIDLRYLEKDYAGLVEELKKPKYVHGVNAKRHYAIRSLLHLKRHDDARKMAETGVRKREMAHLLLILVPASQGNEAETIRLLSDLGANSLLLPNCYMDFELGPILRGAGFEKFRAQFPEPPSTSSIYD